MSSAGSILVVEDDEADLFLLRRSFADAGVGNPLQIARDGKECIDILASLRPAAEPASVSAPRLVLLDLKMPRLSGIDVLRWLCDQPVLRSIPVVVLSSSANQRDIEQAYALGANAFVSKPSSIEQRAAFARAIKEFWLGFNHPPLVCTENFTAARKLHAAAGLGSMQL